MTNTKYWKVESTKMYITNPETPLNAANNSVLVLKEYERRHFTVVDIKWYEAFDEMVSSITKGFALGPISLRDGIDKQIRLYTGWDVSNDKLPDSIIAQINESIRKFLQCTLWSNIQNMYQVLVKEILDAYSEMLFTDVPTGRTVEVRVLYSQVCYDSSSNNINHRRDIKPEIRKD